VIRQQRKRIERGLKKFHAIPSDEKLTASSGIGLLVEVFYKSPLFEQMQKHLPERVSHLSHGSSRLALTMLAGHLLGVESVEDLEEVRDDEFLLGLFDGTVPAPRTILDFLNDFTPEHISGLNEFLNTMSQALHRVLLAEFPDKVSKTRIIDIDSTYHTHYGECTEGLAFNYKNDWCLESQSAFSSLGLCHQVWLRPGNTKSGTDVDIMIRDMFDNQKDRIERKRAGLDLTRMDSAFCNQYTIRACLDRGLFFTITANKATTFWHKEMETQGIDWKPWVYSEKELKKFANAGVEPTRIELGRIWWRPSWGDGKLVFPIIIKRTWQSSCKIKDKPTAQASLFAPETTENSGGWDYYAIVTNHDLVKQSYQEVMLHHQKRASSENMNKEAKYGYKLNNFPCRGLVANQAWYVFAMIAHNMMRFLSLMEDPEHPHMAKKTRRKFINFPAKVYERSKKFWLIIPRIFYKEVFEKIEGWRFPEKVSAHILSTA